MFLITWHYIAMTYGAKRASDSAIRAFAQTGNVQNTNLEVMMGAYDSNGIVAGNFAGFNGLVDRHLR